MWFYFIVGMIAAGAGAGSFYSSFVATAGDQALKEQAPITQVETTSKIIRSLRLAYQTTPQNFPRIPDRADSVVISPEVVSRLIRSGITVPDHISFSINRNGQISAEVVGDSKVIADRYAGLERKTPFSNNSTLKLPSRDQVHSRNDDITPPDRPYTPPQNQIPAEDDDYVFQPPEPTPFPEVDHGATDLIPRPPEVQPPQPANPEPDEGNDEDSDGGEDADGDGDDNKEGDSEGGISPPNLGDNDVNSGPYVPTIDYSETWNNLGITLLGSEVENFLDEIKLVALLREYRALEPFKTFYTPILPEPEPEPEPQLPPVEMPPTPTADSRSGEEDEVESAFPETPYDTPIFIGFAPGTGDYRTERTFADSCSISFILTLDRDYQYLTYSADRSQDLKNAIAADMWIEAVEFEDFYLTILTKSPDQLTTADHQKITFMYSQHPHWRSYENLASMKIALEAKLAMDIAGVDPEISHEWSTIATSLNALRMLCEDLLTLKVDNNTRYPSSPYKMSEFAQRQIAPSVKADLEMILEYLPDDELIYSSREDSQQAIRHIIDAASMFAALFSDEE